MQAVRLQTPEPPAPPAGAVVRFAELAVGEFGIVTAYPLVPRNGQLVGRVSAERFVFFGALAAGDNRVYTNVGNVDPPYTGYDDSRCRRLPPGTALVFRTGE
jgi:hypothetical protein